MIIAAAVWAILQLTAPRYEPAHGQCGQATYPESTTAYGILMRRENAPWGVWAFYATVGMAHDSLGIMGGRTIRFPAETQPMGSWFKLAPVDRAGNQSPCFSDSVLRP